MRMVLAARLNPTGMIAFFETLQREEGSSTGGALAYLQSHPPAGDRLARLKSIAATWHEEADPLLSRR